MKKIESSFVRGGFAHKQIKRVEKVAIFKRWSKNGTSDYHYEVVKISSHNGYKLGGAYIDAAETYPGASLWGIQGWTCRTLEHAEERFEQACVRFNKLNKRRPVAQLG